MGSNHPFLRGRAVRLYTVGLGPGPGVCCGAVLETYVGKLPMKNASLFGEIGANNAESSVIVYNDCMEFVYGLIALC